MRNKNFTGYVLSGGKSSRMGKDKALLEFDGKTFLENAADALLPNCLQVKIVLNSSQTRFIEKIPDNVSHIFDIFENRGALGGIHAALRDCENEFTVILAVDLPFVSSESVERLCEIFINSPDFSAIVPRQNDGKLQPLCAVYRTKDCLSEIEVFLQTEESASVKHFLDKMATKIISCENLSQSKSIFLNVNYPEDLQELE